MKINESLKKIRIGLSLSQIAEQLGITKELMEKIEIIKFGKKLKKIREDNKLSQLDFSEKLNIDSSQYSKIERDLLLPTLTQIINVISIFKVSSSWIFEDVEKSQKIDYNTIIEEKEKIINTQKDEIIKLQKTLLENWVKS